MKNIEALLAEIGIELPEEKKEAFNKAFHENYKTTAEFSKAVSKSESYKEQAEQATATLKKFEGMEPEKVKAEVDAWKKRAEDAEKEYNAKLAAKDYEDVLAKEIENYKFSSSAAKKAILAQIKSANLPCQNGKILGLNDLVETIKAEDATAFVSDAETNKPKFTTKPQPKAEGLTKEQILAIKDTAQRQAAISENMDLFK